MVDVNKVDINCQNPKCKHSWKDTLDENKKIIYRKDEKEKVTDYRFQCPKCGKHTIISIQGS